MEAILARCVPFIPPARLPLLAQFLRFGLVGGCGFVVDTATTYGLRPWIGVYAAMMAAYGTAATVTWLLNRIWTFRGQGSGPAHRQWLLFLAANAIGFVLNRGTASIVVATSALAYTHPVIGLFFGTLAGMFVNFHLSRRIVFA